jgi:hypothetical protein
MAEVEKVEGATIQEIDFTLIVYSVPYMKHVVYSADSRHSLFKVNVSAC